MVINLSTLLFPLYLVASFTLISSQNYEYDSTIKTMEEFSGYPFPEPGAKDSSSTLSVDVESLQRQIDELASFSDTPAPSVTRVLYSEKDVLARRYIKDLMGLAGLSVKEDAVGNIFGRWEGSEAELAAVSTGSHIDAIPYSGKYDGVVGVLGAIEAINVLKRYAGFKPKRSLEVIMFTSEEPTRFGISCLGSRLLAGSKELVERLETTVDNQDISFSDAARFAGYAQEDVSTVFLNKGHYHAFIELHIEQGPILEEEAQKVTDQLRASKLSSTHLDQLRKSQISSEHQRSAQCMYISSESRRSTQSMSNSSQRCISAQRKQNSLQRRYSAQAVGFQLRASQIAQSVSISSGACRSAQDVRFQLRASKSVPKVAIQLRMSHISLEQVEQLRACRLAQDVGFQI
ncbi:hypothetical protein F511_32205 [Dorcoceras hygrometricum]|uniref:Ureidoglycolate hydrolase n=1 Tax=Dorcoceras hygrometricum TaxID=472368 RepID=A0A2Z7AHQ8_9LAMI|nr:hypothetical protein F511_32205 [Dorcoceras hygrometricum]